MKINKKNSSLVSLVILSLVVSLNLISAFGFSYSHDDNTDPLTVYPGEVKNTSIRLTTGPDEGNRVVKAQILDDAEIASILDSSLEYSINPGVEGSAIVNIRLKVPEDAVVGDKYIVSLRFSDVTPSQEGGMVGVEQASSVNLNVFVVEKPVGESSQGEGLGSTWWIIIIVLIIAIIAVIYFIGKNKK